MGTLVRVTVYAADEQAARDAFRVAFDRIAELDRLLSDYRPDSELNRLAEQAAGREVAVSSDLFTVLRAAQGLAEQTGGAFDVTQGPVIRLWRHARRTAQLPDRPALDEAASRSGYRKLHLNDDRRTVRLAIGGMSLDVGAIGKGYAASEAIEALEQAGVRCALVAISGDLGFGDAPPGKAGWRIRIRPEEPSLAEVPEVLELTNGAVSTAGASEQHVDIDGRRYSHIIDPSSRTGLIEDLTVTVIARHGLEADGLDTAISVLGAERGLQLVESRPDVAALVIKRSARETTVVRSTGFQLLVREDEGTKLPAIGSSRR